MKVDPKKRPRLPYYRDDKDDVSHVLLSALEKTSKNPEIKVQWEKFHLEIKISTEIKIDERTQASRDVYQEVTQFILNANTAQMATGGTNLHDQKNSNLCAYFATLSVLRHQLRKIVGDEESGNGTNELNERYKGLKIFDYIKQKDADEKLFERTLTVMIGCVSPRSLAVKFKDNIILFSSYFFKKLTL